MFETHPLDGPFGVEIVGVDLNEVDDALMRRLAARCTSIASSVSAVRA